MEFDGFLLYLAMSPPLASRASGVVGSRDLHVSTCGPSGEIDDFQGDFGIVCHLWGRERCPCSGDAVLDLPGFLRKIKA